MALHKVLLALGTLLLLPATAVCSDPKVKPSGDSAADRPLSTATRFDIIRGLNAEFVFVRKPFPMGGKGLSIKNGVVSPNDEQLNFILAQSGPAAKPGDRAKITDVLIKENSIIFEINGGPKKKKKWYQHIEAGVGSSGATVPVAPDNSENAHGSFVALMFDRYVPDIQPEEIKHMLAPVFDFNSLSATQAYVDTLPPKAREAVKNHEVLVGMNKEMVVASKGRPEQKVREHDDRGEYEEWIYGMPPQEMEFVRLYGDEVGRVEIMKVDGQKVVRTEKEVEVERSGMAQPQTNEPTPAPGEAGQPGAPSLRRPGEALPNDGDDEGQVVTEHKTIGLPRPQQSPVPGSDIPPPNTPQQLPQPQQPPQQQPPVSH